MVTGTDSYKIFTCILFTLFLTSIKAQKTKSEFLYFHYTQLPKKKLPDEMKTYSVTLRGSYGAPMYPSSQQAMEEILKLDGYKKVPKGGHLRIVYSQSTAKNLGTKIETRTETYKDKNDQEKKRTLYFAKYKFLFTAHYKIIDYLGNEILSGNLNQQESRKSREYQSFNKCRNNSNVNYKSAMQAAAKSALSSFHRKMTKRIHEEIDYQFATEGERLHWINKAPEEEETRRYVDEIVEISKDMKATEMDEPNRKLFNEAAAYFEQVGDKYTDMGMTKKKYRSIAWDMLMNAYLLRYYNDQFDQARELSDRLIQLDVKDAKSKSCLKRVDETLQNLEKFGLKTLHFERDVADAIPPAKVAELEAEFEEELERSNIFAGWHMNMDGDTTKGYFFVEKDVEQLQVYENANFDFRKEKTSEAEAIMLNTSNIKKLMVGDDLYEFKRTDSYATGKKNTDTLALRVIYHSPKISLYEFLLPKGASRSDIREFGLEKQGEEMVSLLSTSFLLFNKGMAKYFASCPDLSKMSSDGELKMNEVDLMKACRIYTELCN